MSTLYQKGGSYHGKPIRFQPTNPTETSVGILSRGYMSGPPGFGASEKEPFSDFSDGPSKLGPARCQLLPFLFWLGDSVPLLK